MRLSQLFVEKGVHIVLFSFGTSI